MDARHQVASGVDQRPSRRKTGPGVGRELFGTRHVVRSKHEFGCSVPRRAGVKAEALANRFPGQAAFGHGGRVGAHLADGDHPQRRVRCLQREERSLVAIHIGRPAALRRCWKDVQPVAEQLLAGRVHRLQVHHVLGGLNGRRVVVAGFVGDAKFHQAPRLWPVSPVWVKYFRLMSSESCQAASLALFQQLRAARDSGLANQACKACPAPTRRGRAAVGPAGRGRRLHCLPAWPAVHARSAPPSPAIAGCRGRAPAGRAVP